MKHKAPNGRRDSAAQTVTIPRKVLADLLTAHSELLDFAETYGPSKRASWEDWSGCFEQSYGAQERAEKSLKHATLRAAYKS